MPGPMYTLPLDRVANQPPAEGIHPFIITEITEGESSNQNPMWTVRLQCLSEGPDAGKEVTLWLVLTDNMRWKVEKFLDAVGAPETGDATYNQFIGRKFKAQINHRKQDGRVLADVGEMFPMSSAPKSSSPTPPARAAGGPKAAQRTGAGPATAHVAKTKSAGLPPDATGNDIPFEAA